MPLTDRSHWTLDPRAGGSSIPPEVQLHIAGYLLSEDIVPEPQQHAILARLLLVSRTFLYFGMGELYGNVSLKASEDSVSLLRQMRYEATRLTWYQNMGLLIDTFFLQVLSTNSSLPQLDCCRL
jgi:hypothetical protein